MRSHLKILMVVGLLALMMPLLLGYITGPVGAAHPNTIGQHQSSKTVSNTVCKGCHNNVLGHEVGTTAQPGAHKQHLVSLYLNFSGLSDGCGTCHEESVYGGNGYYTGENYDGLGSGYEGDLSYSDTDSPNPAPGSNFRRAARKQVKPGVCASCHGRFRMSASHTAASLDFYNNAADRTGCKTNGCHDNDSDLVTVDHAGADYIKNYLNPAKCQLCHGKFPWYQTDEGNIPLP